MRRSAWRYLWTAPDIRRKLLITLGILVIYPLWEVIFLGRPTSDSVHDFHKFLESKIGQT